MKLHITNDSKKTETAAHAIHPVGRELAVMFDKVSFSYGSVPVLENASFHIHKGEFVALVGPNGTGKTTILKLILGLEQPQSGRVELFNASDKRAWRSKLGYVSQLPPADQHFPIMARDVVRMGLLRPTGRYSAADNAAVDEVMEQAEISDLSGRAYRALSGGQKRRVLVARALAAKPELFILDEPTANMDAHSEERLFETLGKLKGATTILVVTHDTHFVSVLTDRVLCLGVDGDRQIVQHRTEAAGEGESLHHKDAQHKDTHHGEWSAHGARVLHGETIPADDCYGGECHE